jgi:hypothetical protein
MEGISRGKSILDLRIIMELAFNKLLYGKLRFNFSKVLKFYIKIILYIGISRVQMYFLLTKLLN